MGFFKAHRVANSDTRLKVTDGKLSELGDKKNPFSRFLLMSELGSMDEDFFAGLTQNLVNNIATRGRVIDEGDVNFVLAVVKGIKPKDEIELMLAITDGSDPPTSDDLRAPPSPCREHSAAGQRGARVEQAGANVCHADGGTQALPVWWRAESHRAHVSVGEGGQAIVGNVTQAGRGNQTAKGRCLAQGAPLHQEIFSMSHR